MDILKKIGILGKGDKCVNPNEKIYANIYKSTVFIQNPEYINSSIVFFSNF